MKIILAILKGFAAGDEIGTITRKEKRMNEITIAWICTIGVIVGAFVIPEWIRYEERLDAENMVQVHEEGRRNTLLNEENNVKVNELRIAQTNQLVKVEEQRAAIKVAEAHGIAAAQKIINATLTDKYLQHEAIQAQREMANSPNHSTVYIPVGNNGIPVVHTIE